MGNDKRAAPLDPRVCSEGRALAARPLPGDNNPEALNCPAVRGRRTEINVRIDVAYTCDGLITVRPTELICGRRIRRWRGRRG